MIKIIDLIKNFNIETLNKKLFLMINATPKSSAICIKIARFLAKDLILILIIFYLIFLFFSKNKNFKKVDFILKTTFSFIYSIIFYLFFSIIFPYPRPFTIFFGYQFIDHISNNSYPSKHSIVSFTFAFSFFFCHYWLLRILMIITSIIISWSRVYLGIHWPLDIFGGILVSTISCILAQKTFKFFYFKNGIYL